MSTHSAECCPHTCRETEISRRAPSMNAACGWTLIRKTSLLRKIEPIARQSSFANKDHLQLACLADVTLKTNERRNDSGDSEGSRNYLHDPTRIDLLFTMSEIPHARPIKDSAGEAMFRGRRIQ